MLLRRKKRNAEETVVEQVTETPEVEEISEAEAGETETPMELVEEEAVATDVTSVPLIIGDVNTVWNLTTEPVADFSSVIFENPKEAYLNLANHVASRPEELELYGIDLTGELVTDEDSKKKLALTANEAWDLSVALVQEINARKEEEFTKRIIVFVNQAKNLFLSESAQSTELPANMRVVLEEGGEHGIHLLFV